MILRIEDFKEPSYSENIRIFLGDDKLSKYWAQKYSYENIIQKELDNLLMYGSTPETWNKERNKKPLKLI